MASTSFMWRVKLLWRPQYVTSSMWTFHVMWSIYLDQVAIIVWRNLVTNRSRAPHWPLTLAHVTRNLKERMPNMVHGNGLMCKVALGSCIQNSSSVEAWDVTMCTQESNSKVRLTSNVCLLVRTMPRDSRTCKWTWCHWCDNFILYWQYFCNFFYCFGQPFFLTATIILTSKKYFKNVQKSQNNQIR